MGVHKHLAICVNNNGVELILCFNSHNVLFFCPQGLELLHC